MRIKGGSSYRERIRKRDKTDRFLSNCQYVIDAERNNHVTNDIWNGF